MIKIPRILVDFLLSYTKSARIDAALISNGSRSRPVNDFVKPGAKPREENGNKYWDSEDLLRRWQITTNFHLKISNNSLNPAYNLELTNPHDIFDNYEQPPRLTILKPGESLNLSVQFDQFVIAEKGVGAGNTPDIPLSKENKYIVIEYENEKGRKFQTHSLISLKRVYNVYRFKE